MIKTLPSKLITTDRFVLFSGGWASQWFASPFVVESVTYGCAEQFMMAEKARVFGDVEAERAILAATEPAKQKALGRKVRGFDEEVWYGVCRGIVYHGNYARFEQNGQMAMALLDTGDRTIVEASPMDRVWGVGLAKEDPRVLDPAKWRGANWLGMALMQVRDELRRHRGGEVPAREEWLIEQLERREAMRRAASAAGVPHAELRYPLD